MNIQFPFVKGELTIQHVKNIEDNQPTIIFLHDALGCIEIWRDFPKSLADKANCSYLVYDRLGYGKSSEDPDILNRDKEYLEKEANILLKIIDALKIKCPILFGHSDGGSIALIAAAKSKQIKGIIVEAAHIFVEDITLQGIRKVQKDYETTALRTRLSKYHGLNVNSVFKAWADTWLSEDFRDWNIEAFLPKITCPCLILQGENDEFGTLNQVEGIQSGVSGKVEKVIVENVGHIPHKENQAYILDIATKFIESRE